MAVPKRKVSKSRARSKRTGYSLKAVKGSGLCSNSECRQPVMPHRICPECGTYNGKKLFEESEEA